MERLNSQLYEKYINLKKRKFSEIEESNKRNASCTLKYQSAVDQLIEGLKSENDNLAVKVVSLHEQYQGCQELLLQERQRTKALSNEVELLKEALMQKYEDLQSVPLGSPYRKPSIKIKDSIDCLPMNDAQLPSPEKKAVESEKTATIDSDNRLVPDCCRRTNANYGAGAEGSCSLCAFHTLVELLVGMKFSVECQSEELCFSVIHQMSGYSFTLRWLKEKDGRDDGFLYRVSSLGTVENIALEWMKDEIIFSLAMCPVFFDRISKILGNK